MDGIHGPPHSPGYFLRQMGLLVAQFNDRQSLGRKGLQAQGQVTQLIFRKPRLSRLVSTERIHHISLESLFKRQSVLDRLKGFESGNGLGPCTKIASPLVTGGLRRHGEEGLLNNVIHQAKITHERE